MQLEWHQLSMKYEALRIEDADRQTRLMASLAQVGQQAAVIVVEEGDRYVLVDGYARVRALRKLGHDTAWAVMLPMVEIDALVMCHRLVSARRRTAIEDGWFVRELAEGHGMSLREVARKLGRSTSWVSRRLALVRELPSTVQAHVRTSKVCAHAAMRYLVPLARANRGDCEKIADGIAGHGLSASQVGRIYHAWKKADAGVRQRIVAEPMLLVKSVETNPKPPSDPGDIVLRDIEAIGGLSRRARRKLRDGDTVDAEVHDAWKEAQRAFDLLGVEIVARVDAGQRHETGDSASAS
jgi:ParB-like chromosome segregation protein Spo0J